MLGYQNTAIFPHISCYSAILSSKGEILPKSYFNLQTACAQKTVFVLTRAEHSSPSALAPAASSVCTLLL